jgi:hypothetical protein
LKSCVCPFPFPCTPHRHLQLSSCPPSRDAFPKCNVMVVLDGSKHPVPAASVKAAPAAPAGARRYFQNERTTEALRWGAGASASSPLPRDSFSPVRLNTVNPLAEPLRLVSRSGDRVRVTPARTPEEALAATREASVSPVPPRLNLQELSKHGPDGAGVEAVTGAGAGPAGLPGLPSIGRSGSGSSLHFVSPDFAVPDNGGKQSHGARKGVGGHPHDPRRLGAMMLRAGGSERLAASGSRPDTATAGSGLSGDYPDAGSSGLTNPLGASALLAMLLRPSGSSTGARAVAAPGPDPLGAPASLPMLGSSSSAGAIASPAAREPRHSVGDSIVLDGRAAPLRSRRRPRRSQGW